MSLRTKPKRNSFKRSFQIGILIVLSLTAVCTAAAVKIYSYKFGSKEIVAPEGSAFQINQDSINRRRIEDLEIKYRELNVSYQILRIENDSLKMIRHRVRRTPAIVQSQDTL
jgi:hypothetical protein